MGIMLSSQRVSEQWVAVHIHVLLRHAHDWRNAYWHQCMFAGRRVMGEDQVLQALPDRAQGGLTLTPEAPVWGPGGAALY